MEFREVQERPVSYQDLVSRVSVRPVQILAVQGLRRDEAEKDLLFALLEQTVILLLNKATAKKASLIQEWWEDCEWLFSNSYRFLSYLHICDTLLIEPEVLRQAVREAVTSGLQYPTHGVTRLRGARLKPMRRKKLEFSKPVAVATHKVIDTAAAAGDAA